MCSEVLLPFNRTNNQVAENPTLCARILSPEGGWLQRVGRQLQLSPLVVNWETLLSWLCNILQFTLLQSVMIVFIAQAAWIEGYETWRGKINAVSVNTLKRMSLLYCYLRRRVLYLSVYSRKYLLFLLLIWCQYSISCTELLKFLKTDSSLTILLRDLRQCWVSWWCIFCFINPLNPELNPICYLLALLGAHHFRHVSGIRVKSLTFKRLTSYIYIYIYIYDISRLRVNIMVQAGCYWSRNALLLIFVFKDSYCHSVWLVLTLKQFSIVHIYVLKCPEKRV